MLVNNGAKQDNNDWSPHETFKKGVEYIPADNERHGQEH